MVLAHRTLSERGRADVVLPMEMPHLLEMGLYNPCDSRNTLPHILSHVFRFATSLSMAQLQMFDGLIDTLTTLQNNMVHNVQILNEESQGHLKAAQEAVSGPLY
jgi:hypothetical protein